MGYLDVLAADRLRNADCVAEVQDAPDEGEQWSVYCYKHSWFRWFDTEASAVRSAAGHNRTKHGAH
jgi:hypothetical protein